MSEYPQEKKMITFEMSFDDLAFLHWAMRGVYGGQHDFNPECKKWEFLFKKSIADNFQDRFDEVP